MKTRASVLAIILIALHIVCLFADDHIFTLPVSGNDLKVSAGWYYPDGTSHSAIDYISSSGTGIINGRDIYAACGGVVIQVVSSVSDNTGTGFGNYIKIDHQNGYISLYGHMLCNSAAVSQGDIVIQGQVIGRVGNTGNSTGYHLHFQIWKNGAPVDPYGWYTYPNNSGNPYVNCNPGEYYFTENPPIHAPSSVSAQRTVPDDVICHVIGTPDYYWVQDGLMNHFDNEPPFYSWSWNWEEAIEVTQSEVSRFQAGPNVKMKVGTCVYDQNYERWVFDYASDTSPVIVKRRATNWQSLGYASNVWVPVLNSFMTDFNQGPDLLSGYPYGAVLKNGTNRYVLVKGERFGSSYAGQKMRLPLFSNDTYNVNYYHYNLNIEVSQSVLANYPLAPNNTYECIMDGKLIRGSGSAIYYLENGLKRHILDATTFTYYGFDYANVIQVSDVDVYNFQNGPDISFAPSGGLPPGEGNFDGGEINDGGFDSGLPIYWTFNDWQHFANFQVTNANSVSGAFKADVQINSASNFYDVELKQLVATSGGHNYHISFWVRSDAPMSFKLALQRNVYFWNNYGLWKEITSTTDWVKHQYIFFCNTDDNLARLTFMLGQNTGHIYFDQVVFERLESIDSTPGNLLFNSDFELGHYSPWVMEDNNNVAFYYTDNINYHSGNNSMYIDPNQNGQFFEVQLRQNISVDAGQLYYVSFWAKANQTRSLKLDLYNDGAPWNNFGLWKEFQIGTQWQKYETHFTASQSGYVRFGIHLGDQDIPIWLDDVVITDNPPANYTSNEDEVSQLNSFDVLQNYPNPFNSQTQISYSLKNRKAIMSIYNVKGELVNSFCLDSSKRSLSWNGIDKNGCSVANGIYFYSICDGVNKSKTRKMIYLK